MAYFVDIAITENAAGGGTSPIAANMPPHQTDDVLIMFAAVNGTAGGTSGNTNSGITVTGWTQIGTFQNAAGGQGSAVYYKKAASSSETCSVAIATIDDFSIKVACFRDVDTTNALDASTPISSNTAAASQWASPAFSTTQNDSLVIYYHAHDGVTPMLHSEPGVHHILSSDSTGTTANTSAGSALAWSYKRTAGSVPTANWTANTSAARTNHVFALRNKSGGRIPAYVDAANTIASSVIGGHHYTTTALNNTTFTATPTITNIGPGGAGKAVTGAAGVLTADYGINPYSSAIANTITAATASTAVRGFECTFTNTIDLSNAFLVGTLANNSPKGSNYAQGSVKEGGVFVTLASGTTSNQNWASFQIAGRDSKPNTEGRMVFSIKPNTTTFYGRDGTNLLSASAVKRFQLMMNAPTAATANACSIYLSDMYRVQKITAAGGDATNPVDSDGLAEIGRSFRAPVIEKFGAAGLIAYVPVQIGGGDAINFQIDAGAFQFPRVYNATLKEINFHADINAIGISYAGKSGDVIKHTNSVVTSATPYYWEINSAATNAATWDFSGLVVVNANVTLRNVMTFTGMSFSDCLSINASSCTLTQSKVSITATTANKFVVNGTSSITNCDFDTTGISSGVALTQTSNPSIFQNNTFVGSSTTGHAIEITSPGTYSFTGNKFTGYGGTGGDNLTPNSGSTSAAIYNNSGGAVILQVAGGGDVPSVRNGAGATTDIQASASVTLTGLKSDSEVRVYLGTNPSTSTEIAGVESSGTSFNFAQSAAGSAGYIQIFHVNYQPVFLELTFSGSDQEIPIQQITDRQYARGSIFTPG